MFFAQQAVPPNAAVGFAAGFLIGFCTVLILALTIYIFFLMMLMNTLNKCSPRNRKMEPGLVWLNLVPCLHYVWLFVTVLWVADSLKNEFRSRGIRHDDDYGKTIGLSWLILSIAGSIISNVLQGIDPQMAIVGVGVSVATSVASLILFIMYWVKISGYRRELSETPEDGYDDEYEDEDRIRKRRRRHDDDDEEDDDPGFDFRDRDR